MMTRMSEQTLGEMIRAARVRRGLTQEELAGQLGVKTSYISQWETGARKWPQEYVRQLSRLLGLAQVDMAVAAGLIDAPAEVSAVPPYPPGSVRALAMELVGTMTDDEVQALVDAVPILMRLART